jgi:hypothetical protein
MDGRLSFTSLAPAPYTVRELQPAAMLWSTTPDETTVTLSVGSGGQAAFGDWNGLPMWLPLLVR